MRTHAVHSDAERNAWNMAALCHTQTCMGRLSNFDGLGKETVAARDTDDNTISLELQYSKFSLEPKQVVSCPAPSLCELVILRNCTMISSRRLGA